MPRSRLGDNLLRLSAEGLRGVRDAVQQAGDDLASIARTTTAPIDTGHLRRSIFAEAAEAFEAAMGKTEVFVDVRADTDYAYMQHEGDFKHPRGGQRFYFTDPLKRRANRYQGFISKAAGNAVARAGARAQEDVIE